MRRLYILLNTHSWKQAEVVHYTSIDDVPERGQLPHNARSKGADLEASKGVDKKMDVEDIHEVGNNSTVEADMLVGKRSTGELKLGVLVMEWVVEPAVGLVLLQIPFVGIQIELVRVRELSSQ